MDQQPTSAASRLAGFIRTAQYLAGLSPDQDAWDEIGRALLGFFAVDVAAVGEGEAHGEVTWRCWHSMDGSARASDCLDDEARVVAAEVLGTGFLVSRRITAPEPMAAAFLPVPQGRQTAAVLVLAHRHSDRIPRDLLDTYLAVAGLAGTTVARLAAEREAQARRLELEKANVDLTTAQKELAELVRALTHDLRTPLRAIAGFSQIIAEDNAPRLDEAGLRDLDRIRSATMKMGTLIDDLGQLSKISLGELHPVEIDIGDLAAGIAAEFRAQSPERDVELAIASGLHAHADPALIQVALSALISNAFKFTSTRPRAHIEVGCETVHGECAFFVRDDGVGFDMAYVDKLFGTFERLHDADAFGGTGIGLVTVRRIVARHHGRVWAEGSVGNGATFWFTLPDAGTGRRRPTPD